MSVRKKIEIEKIVDKGAQVISDKDKGDYWTTFCLRIKKSMSREIDLLLERKVGITKTGFILQAIHEKIKRDQDGE